VDDQSFLVESSEFETQNLLKHLFDLARQEMSDQKPIHETVNNTENYDDSSDEYTYENTEYEDDYEDTDEN